MKTYKIIFTLDIMIPNSTNIYTISYSIAIN